MKRNNLMYLGGFLVLMACLMLLQERRDEAVMGMLLSIYMLLMSIKIDLQAIKYWRKSDE